MHAEGDIFAFRQAVDDCDLLDLGFRGPFVHGSIVIQALPLSKNVSTGFLVIWLGNLFSLLIP